MNTNLVSATLSAEDQQMIMDSINTIFDKLPFLMGLSPTERKRLCSMGDKSRAFVNKAAEFAAQNGELMPGCLDVEELRRDIALLDSLYPVMLAIEKLQGLIEDTYRQVGSEAYAAARSVYKSARANGMDVGVDASIEDMGRRFTRRNRSKAEPEQPAG